MLARLWRMSILQKVPPARVSGRKLTVYTVGSGKQALIFIHDIFGFDFKQVRSAAPDLRATRLLKS